MKQIMIFIIVFFFAFCLIYMTNLDKTSRRFLVFFVGYWCIATFLSLNNIGGLCEVSSSTYSLVYIHLISFCLGFNVIRIRNSKFRIISRESIDTSINSLMNNTFFRIILIVSTIYICSLYIQFFQSIFILGSMTEARGEYYGGGGDIYGPLFFILNQFILEPLNIILLPVFAYKLYYKRDWIFWVIALYVIILASLSGGRIGYIRIAAAGLCVLYCIFDSIKSKRKLGLYAIISVVAIYLLLVVTSAARTGSLEFDKESLEIGNEVAKEHLATYSAGPIAALDYSINQDYLNRTGGYKYGRLTLTSLDRMTCMVLRRFGIHAVDAMDSMMELKQETYISLGDVRFNALYTAILIYYNDFGIWGVLFIPFLLGLFIRILIKRMYDYNSLPFVILVTWFFYIMIRSVMDFGFYNPSDVVVLFILYRLGKIHRIV